MAAKFETATTGHERRPGSKKYLQSDIEGKKRVYRPHSGTPFGVSYRLWRGVLSAQCEWTPQSAALVGDAAQRGCGEKRKGRARKGRGEQAKVREEREGGASERERERGSEGASEQESKRFEKARKEGNMMRAMRKMTTGKAKRIRCSSS